MASFFSFVGITLTLMREPTKGRIMTDKSLLRRTKDTAEVGLVFYAAAFGAGMLLHLAVDLVRAGMKKRQERDDREDV
jgi:hypothetical protein